MSLLLINQYYRDLENRIRYSGSRNEGSVRIAFANLLNGYGKTKDFILVEELTIASRINTKIRLDGVVKDALRLDWGYWEAKDEKDNLDEEIETKLKKGYPTDNIIFEDTQTAVLIQNGAESLRINMKNPAALDKLLKQFLDFERAEVKDFRQAINSFSQDLPTILATLRNLIDAQSGELSNDNNQTTFINHQFIEARAKILKLCQESINPEINNDDIREMMIQHILTEDIFTNIFNDAQFHQENNIARQLQEVIKTFFTGNIKRNTLKTIESYYSVIIRTASNIVNHQEKQKFLKVLYENFYKAYNPKSADRLGIVYTPNEIVKFMVESTDYLLDKHFGKTLGDKGVEILDPATGTGTFITEILEHLLISDIKYKYLNEIHCNELSILPYYIANLNIEYTYQQKTGEYLEFNNICLVDTLDHTTFAGKQMDLFSMTQENTERIKRQNERKISVIIGNPPYNANQQNENDNNKNREYPAIDKRIKDTYVKESTAQKTKVYDMYARFYRWATDRLNEDGIIAFVTNNSFINARTFDGFRKTVAQDFDYIYVIDLGGDVRKNPKLSGTTHNVFGIQAGVAIAFLVKTKEKKNQSSCKIFYTSRPEVELAKDKLHFLSSNKLSKIDFDIINPDKDNNWIDLTNNDFDALLPLANKETKLAKNKDEEKAVFKLFSLGVVTARDEWLYDFSFDIIKQKIKFFCEIYNQLKTHYINNQSIEQKLVKSIKLTSELEDYLRKRGNLDFQENLIVKSAYRPFTKKYLYFQRKIIHRFYQIDQIFYLNKDNIVIGITCHKQVPFVVQVTNCVYDYGLGSRDTQGLPLYTYDKNGTRQENITDWGLQQFREYYTSPPQPLSPLGEGLGVRLITKQDIFHYIYAVLHNPKYREKYELNLKRELPRIPFYNDFWQWAKWGKELMELHLNYERVEPYPLKRIEIDVSSEGERQARRLPSSDTYPPQMNLKPKLKADKINNKILIDEVTTLENIPPIAWEYVLGNRSAMEWILDQYKEKNLKDKTITEKFNTYRFADYKEQVIDLLMRVCTVSVKTKQIIREMETKVNSN